MPSSSYHSLKLRDKKEKEGEIQFSYDPNTEMLKQIDIPSLYISNQKAWDNRKREGKDSTRRRMMLELDSNKKGRGTK